MKIVTEDKCTNLVLSIPFITETEEEAPRSWGFALDCVGAFSSYLIELLSKRRIACYSKLVAHLDSIYFNNGFEIKWKRKDGSSDYFNVPSYELMDKAIELLKDGKYKSFLTDIAMLDQTVKAIMNEPNLSHEDKYGFRFSQLVSVLTECLINCVSSKNR